MQARVVLDHIPEQASYKRVGSARCYELCGGLVLYKAFQVTRKVGPPVPQQP